MQDARQPQQRACSLQNSISSLHCSRIPDSLWPTCKRRKTPLCHSSAVSLNHLVSVFLDPFFVQRSCLFVSQNASVPDNGIPFLSGWVSTARFGQGLHTFSFTIFCDPNDIERIFDLSRLHYWNTAHVCRRWQVAVRNHHSNLLRKRQTAHWTCVYIHCLRCHCEIHETQWPRSLFLEWDR